MSSNHEHSPDPPHPLQPALNRLERVISSSGREGKGKSEDATGRAVEGLRGWLRRLVDEPTLTFATAVSFASFASKDRFSFRRPTSAVISAAAAAGDDDDAEWEGEVGEEVKKGRQLRTVLETVKDVMEWAVDGALANEGAEGEGGKVWEDILVGVVEGVKRHLASDPIKGSKWKPDQSAYRSLLATILFPALFRIYLPNPSGIPPSSAHEIDDGGGEGSANVLVEAKYVALELMGELLSKHEENKVRLREIVPPSHLGRVLANSLDCHLSRLTLELAFRLTPGRPRQNPSSNARPSSSDQHVVKRKKFIDGLFAFEWNGTCFEELRVRYEGITSSNWEQETLKLLHTISDKRIERSQRFVALSLKYNNTSLLPTQPTDQGEDSFDVPATPPTFATLATGGPGSYEPTSVWLSRNFIGATIDSEAVREEYGGESVGESDEGEERMTVWLEGVEKVFVQDLGTELNLLRITFLLNSSSPLRLNRRTHPSPASHVGRTLNSADESQVSDALPKTHKLEMIITARGDNLGVLKKTLEERRKRFPNLGKELHNFPHRVPAITPPPSKSSKSSSKPSSKAAAAPSNADHSGSTSSKPRSTAAANGNGGKSVAFASTPAETVEARLVKGAAQKSTSTSATDKGKGKEKEKKPAAIVPRAPRKSSEAIAPVEQVFPAPLPPPSSSADSVAATTTEQPAPVPAATAATAGQSQSQSQSLSQSQRAEEAARLARLEELEEEQEREKRQDAVVQKNGVGEEAAGMEVEQDFLSSGGGGEDFGGGFDDDEQQQQHVAVAASSHPASEAEDESLPRPSQIGRLATLPTSDAALPADEADKAKATPAAPPKSKDGAAPLAATAGKQLRPRASTIGKPRPAEEEDVTPSQRAALGRRESQAQAGEEKEEKGGRVEKAGEGKGAKVVSSDLSELESEEDEVEVEKKGERAIEGAAAKGNDQDDLNLAPAKQPKKAAPPSGAAVPVRKPSASQAIAVVKHGASTSAAGDQLEKPDEQSKRRRSPRLSGSSGSEGESAGTKASAAAKKKKAPAPPPTKKVKINKKGDVGSAQEGWNAKGRPRRAAAAAATKKVVAGMKPRKRARDEQESGAEEEEEEEPSTQDPDEEGERVEKPAKGKATTTTKGTTKGKTPPKKVVKPAAISSRDGKRRKLSHTPSGSDASKAPDDGDESELTDYDSYPAPPSTLEQKRKPVSPGRKYGKEKLPIKPAGGKRKAGQGRKKNEGQKDEASAKGKKPASRGKKGRKSGEGTEVDELENKEPDVQTASKRTTRAQAKAPPKKVVKRAEAASTSGIEDIEDMRPSPLPEDPRKPKDKRVSDDIPPPFDLTSPRKSPAHKAATDNQSNKSRATTPQHEKPITSFSLLVATPQEDREAGRHFLGDHAVEGVGTAKSAEPELEGLVAGVDYPDPDQDDLELGFADDSFLDAAAGSLELIADAASGAPDPTYLEGARQAERLAAKDLSLTRTFSSLFAKPVAPADDAAPAPATDSTAQILADQQRAPAQAKPQPQILVEDTQSDVEAAVALGEHKVVEPAKMRREEEDVEMRDVEQEKEVEVKEKQVEEKEEEPVDTDDLYSATGDVDDSGVKFDVPMDQGVEGDEEEMAAPGADLVVSAAEEGSDERPPEGAALAPPPAALTAKKPNSAPQPSSQIRPLLVEKPARPPHSAESKFDSPPRVAGPAAPVQPVASTSKAQLPAVPAKKAAVPSAQQHQQQTFPEAPKALSNNTTAVAVQAPLNKTRFVLPPQQQQALPPYAAKVVQPILRSSRSRPSIAAYSVNPFTFTSKAQLASPSVGFASLPFAPRQQYRSNGPSAGVHFLPAAAPIPAKKQTKGFTRPLQQQQFPPISMRGKKVKTKSRDKGKGKERAVETDAGQQGDVFGQGGGDEWDQDDEELYAVLDGLNKAMVNQHRQKKRDRQAHHQLSVSRLDKQLSHYLTETHEETENILSASLSYSSTLSAASSPQSRLMQLLKRSSDVNKRLWGEAQGELVALAEGKQ